MGALRKWRSTGTTVAGKDWGEGGFSVRRRFVSHEEEEGTWRVGRFLSRVPELSSWMRARIHSGLHAILGAST